MQIVRSEFLKTRFVPLGLGVHDPRLQQRVMAQDFLELLHVADSLVCDGSATSSRYCNLPIELAKTRTVGSASVILVVAAELGIQGLLLLVHRVMPVLFAPVGDGFQSSVEPFVNRLHAHGELSLPAAGA